MDEIEKIANIVSNVGFPAAIATYYIFFGHKTQKQQILAFNNMNENIKELTKTLRTVRNETECRFKEE